MAQFDKVTGERIDVPGKVNTAATKQTEDEKLEAELKALEEAEAKAEADKKAAAAKPEQNPKRNK